MSDHQMREEVKGRQIDRGTANNIMNMDGQSPNVMEHSWEMLSDSVGGTGDTGSKRALNRSQQQQAEDAEAFGASFISGNNRTVIQEDADAFGISIISQAQHDDDAADFANSMIQGNKPSVP